MPVFTLPQRFEDRFGAPLQHVFALIDWLNQQACEEEIVLDYSRCAFAHPFYSIAVPLVMQQFKRKGYNRLALKGEFRNAGIRDYMGYIKFPVGVDPLAMDMPASEYLAQYRHKTYIPLICFPVGENGDVAEARERFMSALNQLLTVITNTNGTLRNALMYLIDETVNNVLHHSGEEKGYLLAQYYPNKGYIDLAIVDIGNTILQTYQKMEKYGHITTHENAMEAALAGKSTKSLDVDRGFGISTSKEMLTKGLKGKYFLYSGNVYNIYTAEQNVVTALPEKVFWQGAYVCMRIPKMAPQGFDPYDYYGG